MRSNSHSCESVNRVAKKNVSIPCKKCGMAGKHNCAFVKCKTCNAQYKKGGRYKHRCIILRTDDPKDGYAQEMDGKKDALWVYDLESRFVTREIKLPMPTEFGSEDGYFTGQVLVYESLAQTHVANLLVAKNVITGEDLEYFGDDCIEKFILHLLSVNNGRHILLAHNASGYDARLIFDTAVKMRLKTDNSPLTRGGKFLQLKINELKFRDSMLHLPGSLRNLGKDFGAQVAKGYFPILFNTLENYDYVGPIPAKKYFDLAFGIKDDRALDTFNEWYDTWQDRNDWNFKKELIYYCRTDVAVLCQIAKLYDETVYDTFKYSPWHYVTAASMTHDIHIRAQSLLLDIDPKDENYQMIIEHHAKNDAWAVLTQQEYWPARAALRGGRTDIRKVYHRVSDEDWARGVRIRYVDIVSQYPYQQAVHEFPVGLPAIHAYDSGYEPCAKHPKIVCQCFSFNRQLENIDCIRYNNTMHVPTAEEIINDPTFKGIVCASLTPAKVYHPAVVSYSEEEQKCVATCKKIEEQWMTSIEFIRSLKQGSRLDGLHCFHKYKFAPSKWNPLNNQFYLLKMCNSRSAPQGQELEEMIRVYEERFGMGDMIRESIAKNMWGKNPAKKQTFKILMNSGWGKHCERPTRPETVVLDHESDTIKITDMFTNFQNGLVECIDIAQMADTKFLYRFIKEDSMTPPNLHNGYLPAGLFVPAYGRMQLLDQLEKLGERVLMNDTDSIIYIYDPDLYAVPQGTVWGDWEIEGVDTDHGGIREFVGVGPKSYGIKCEDGFTTVKVKGMSLKRATEKLVNFESMKNLVLEAVRTDQAQKISVPQMTFKYSFGHGMSTRYMLKDLSFDVHDQKGTVKDLKIYPPGYFE